MSSVIIRLQNLPLTAISIDIRNFFHGLSIPDGGVHIVGGPSGDAFIAFSTDEDARQAMQMTGQKLKDSPVRLLLSSRNEMFKVIEQARQGTTSNGDQTQVLANSKPPSASPPASHSHSSLPQSVTGVPTFGTSFNMLGMNMGGVSNGTNMLGGGGITGMGASAMSGFGSQMTSASEGQVHAPTSAPFSLPPSLAGMGITFPQMLSASVGSVPGSANNNMSGMMESGFTPSVMNLMAQVPPGFASSQMPNGLQFNLQRNSQMLGGGGVTSQMDLPGSNSLHNNHNHNLPQSQQSNVVRPGGFNGFQHPTFFPRGNMNMHNNSNRPGGPPRGPGGNMAPFRPRVPNASVGPGMRTSFPTPRSIFSKDADSRSPSHERDERRGAFGRKGSERRRSRSRSRDRERRRRSRSRSRSPKSRLSSGRRDSRDKEKDDRRRGDSSPEKGRGRRDSRDIEFPATPYNTTDELHPAVKLTGIPSDASFREIKDFIRVDISGGGDGTVRLYEEGVAYVKLERASDFPKAYRSNGRKLHNSMVAMEGIPMERWVDEYKLNKIRSERDVDRDRERERDKDRDRHHHRDRDDRGSDKPERPARPSRFNSAPRSSYIVVKNLPPTITTREISSRLLSGFSIGDVVVSAGPASPSGRHTAIAYIKFDSPEEAQQAISHIVKSQDSSNPVLVDLSNFEDFNQEKIKTSGGGNGGGGGGGGGGFRGRMEFEAPAPPRQDAQSIFDLEPGLDDESCSILLKGAPPNVAERDIFDFFSDIGLMPMNVKVMYDNDGSCNGQVACEFSDPHKAKRATTKDGMIFGRSNSFVHVELLPSGRKRAPDPGMQMKSQFRPSLLGARPGAGSRFGPPGPNPFVQALQAGPSLRPPRGRGSGPRFGHPRSDMGDSNGADKDDRMGGIGRGSGRGRGRGRGGHTGNGTEPPNSLKFGKSGCVLALENVPYKASMDDILHHLSSILNLDIARERIIRRFDESEKPTGDARVAFDTPAEAKLAHDRLAGTKMWNRLITYQIV